MLFLDIYLITKCDIDSPAVKGLNALHSVEYVDNRDKRVFVSVEVEIFQLLSFTV